MEIDMRKPVIDLSQSPTTNVKMASSLQQWPVQLKLLNSSAGYFDDADLLVTADCVPFAYPNYHQRFLKGKIAIVFCPKLDSGLDEYVNKLTAIIKNHTIKSITILRMEVPCCGGTVKIIEEALRRSGKNVIIKEYVISISGEIV
jgi:hypothetical protein